MSLNGSLSFNALFALVFFGAQTSCHFKNRLHSLNVNTFFPIVIEPEEEALSFFHCCSWISRYMCFYHIAFVLQCTRFLFFFLTRKQFRGTFHAAVRHL